MKCKIVTWTETVSTVGTYWQLEFQFSDEDYNFDFTVMEPHCHSINDWKALANGTGSLHCYCGNGEGSITNQGDHTMFNAVPSGGGGDVSSCFKVRRSVFAKLLECEIRECIEKGFEFSK